RHRHVRFEMPCIHYSGYVNIRLLYPGAAEKQSGRQSTRIGGGDRPSAVESARLSQVIDMVLTVEEDLVRAAKRRVIYVANPRTAVLREVIVHAEYRAAAFVARQVNPEQDCSTTRTARSKLKAIVVNVRQSLSRPVSRKR